MYTLSAANCGQNERSFVQLPSLELHFPPLAETLHPNEVSESSESLRRTIHQLHAQLASSLEQINLQTQLVTDLESSLASSEESRTLLEKQVAQMWTSFRHLGSVLKDENKINDTQVLEERLALQNENIGLKQLAVELQAQITRWKVRYNADKAADENHIQQLFNEILSKTQRIHDLGGWQVTWQETTRFRDMEKDKVINQLRRQIEDADL